MKIRKFQSDGEFRDYVAADGGCDWCEAGKHVNWEGNGGVIFLENDHGEIRRLSGVVLLRASRPLIATSCERVSVHEANAELAQLADL